MVIERNYAIWWLNMFTKWIPKTRDINWKAWLPARVLTLGIDNKWKLDERGSLGFDIRFDDLTCSESEFQRVETSTKKHESHSMSFNPGNRQVKTRWTELSGFGY